MVGLGRYQSGQALFSPLKLRSEGLAPASAAQSTDAIVFAISCQYDNSRPRHHAVANHQAYYAVLSRRLRQRTMIRTRVNPSSITLNFYSFPLVLDLPAPGMRVFFCFGKARPEDEGKPETENTLLSKEEDCPSPLLTGLA